MDRSLINTLVEAIRKADARKTQPYDTQATVTRVENGIAWVHIPGGVDETPGRTLLGTPQRHPRMTRRRTRSARI